MFTGIVAAVGKIMQAEQREKGLRLSIDAGALSLSDVKIGDSIAVNGVCLTAIALRGSEFVVDVSQETIDCTIGLGVEWTAARGNHDGANGHATGAAAAMDPIGQVNLEKSLTLADRLGGHLVSGHVDGVGEVVVFEPVGESWLLRIRAPESLARYIARKGSICVQGVSLTVNRVEGCEFDINLIPHTVMVTTLKHLQAGTRVNLEVDQIARYVERMMAVSTPD